MWTFSEINNYVKSHLKESRYNHTLGVVETAKNLAKINGADERKAEMAALIHDCAKNMSNSEMINILNSKGINIDAISKKSPQILHGRVGAIIAQDVFKVTDIEILKAVEYHTTGKANMSTLEKIIYIADYVEPNRNYDGVDDLRKITFSDLDMGVLKGLENTIVFIIKEENLIHPLTIEARNYMLLEIMKR